MTFDENGYALEEGDVTVYNFNEFSHEYTGSSVEHLPIGFGIPSHSTLIAPPESREGYARCFNNNEWVFVENHLGEVVYNTTTKAQSVVNYLGPIEEGYTNKVPTEYSVWSNGEWVEDTEAKDNAIIQSNTQLKSYYLSIASEQINILTDATEESLVEQVDPNDVALLKSWKLYRIALNKITDMLNPSWPVMPE